jgi:hypothetical protein
MVVPQILRIATGGRGAESQEGSQEGCISDACLLSGGGERRSYSGMAEEGAGSLRLRFKRVSAFLAATCAVVAVVGMTAVNAGPAGAVGSRGAWGVGKEALLQTALSGAVTSGAAASTRIEDEVQEEKDSVRVNELKTKLARAEKRGVRKAETTKGPSPKAAAAAGNKASKALKKGALRDAWLSASAEQQQKAAVTEDKGAGHKYTPPRIKKIQITRVLTDISQSLAAQQAATNAALMLLESEGGQGAESDDEDKHVVLRTEANEEAIDDDRDDRQRKDDADEGARKVEGARGRTGLKEAASLVDCTNFTVTNETECIPLDCNATDINEHYNVSLPECAGANTSNISVAATPAPSVEAEWNKVQNTTEAAIDSGAAGVVQGDVWAGPQKKPQYDTIYCYDDDADGGMTRHARSATYCWYHRAYCELYCEGDIMSTPPPIDMNSPAAAAYGWKGGYVSWTSWAKRLKMLSPYAVFGPAIVGEPKYNNGGINNLHPVKIPETTGGTNGGIFEKPYQDGR